jgi:hypothetical protein
LIYFKRFAHLKPNKVGDMVERGICRKGNIQKPKSLIVGVLENGSLKKWKIYIDVPAFAQSLFAIAKQMNVNFVTN